MLKAICRYFHSLPHHEEQRLALLQRERDDAEINAVLWALKLKHRTRDLDAEIVRLRGKV